MAFSKQEDLIWCKMCGTMLSFGSQEHSECPVCCSKAVEGKKPRYSPKSEFLRRDLDRSIDELEEEERIWRRNQTAPPETVSSSRHQIPVDSPETVSPEIAILVPSWWFLATGIEESKAVLCNAFAYASLNDGGVVLSLESQVAVAGELAAYALISPQKLEKAREWHRNLEKYGAALVSKNTPKEVVFLQFQRSATQNNEWIMKEENQEAKDILCSNTSLRVWSFLDMSFIENKVPLRGLDNVGLVCYMNSILQCLGHTPELAKYFLTQLSMDTDHNGVIEARLAQEFGCLIEKIWSTDSTQPSVDPQAFHDTMIKYVSTFQRNEMHDSQELLVQLLGGLKVGLHRGTAEMAPEPEVLMADIDAIDREANEEWKKYHDQSNSIVNDLFHCQLQRSFLCNVCKTTLSYKFENYMTLEVPIPSKWRRVISVIVVPHDCVMTTCTVELPESANLIDITEQLRKELEMEANDQILMALVDNGQPDFLSLFDMKIHSLKPHNKLVAYIIRKTEGQIVTFTHKFGESDFLVPLVYRTGDTLGIDIAKNFFKLLEAIVIRETMGAGVRRMLMDNLRSSYEYANEDNVSGNSFKGFTFFVDEREIPLNELVTLVQDTNIVVKWPRKMMEMYHVHSVASLLGCWLGSKKYVESISLYNCIELFMQEELLEQKKPCPSCNTEQLVAEKAKIWRMSDVLIISLKRHVWNPDVQDKLEDFVDCPTEIDLSSYCKNTRDSKKYKLYAICNHAGGMWGGHNTASINHCDKWYDFNDARVSPIEGPNLATAYILFYRRV